MPRRIAFAALVSVSVGCSFDIFHDTSWPNACDLDPSLSGCSDGGPGDGDTEDRAEQDEAPLTSEGGDGDSNG
ncbi:MAG TPA: hypothetical protein PLJ27_01040 [Polyangiaceae bacterium]|jgi:hypothetical protein|nr:MAG: hypothetical protein BWY17_02560 [Deltaproteobacteria bacterium ADurb.Bin207]HNS95522.1 hypothetical protein [Polyangiaceae bacterium]HNZ23589.1 hypothetical protein [Polyangiaceae bacterium]HOD22713.1 hypothetical protein [Polyangiaceae bacterium]HOE47735.1 hypothetical protein [Polyangiaceae bacterium]